MIFLHWDLILGYFFLFLYKNYLFISIDVDNFGETKTVDLIPNGNNIPVTETNKKQYI